MTKKVLILEGGAPHAMAVARCLRRSGYQTAVLCDARLTYGYHTRYADERLLGPESGSADYWPFLRELLRAHPFDVLIPCSDHAAECMSRHRDELLGLTGVLMPPLDVFMRAYDKNALMRLLREKGFPHPQTVDLSCEAVPADFPFPALIKPNLTSGARGMTLVDSMKELRAALPAIEREYGPCHLQRFVASGGRQVKVQIMTDGEGRRAHSSVIWKKRFYPVKGGSSCLCQTIADEATAALCGRVLEAVGWVGFADFDLIEDPLTGELLIMEINPRLPACVRCAFESGTDYATMIADATLGLPPRTYHYAPGCTLRHLGFDMLWFLGASDRFRARPSWFHFFGRDTYYQDWLPADFPAFAFGTLGNIIKILNPDFRRAKSGV